MRLTEHEARAIVSLLKTDDFKVYMNLLGNHGEKLMEKFVHSPAGELSLRQGQVQAISDIMKALDSAQQTLQDFKTRNAPQS